jgi:hypothetical protein
LERDEDHRRALWEPVIAMALYRLSRQQ